MVLVSEDRERKYWLAVRDGGGVRLADVHSKEAVELRRLSAVRTDLGYLGAAVQREGSDLRVQGVPPTASAASSLGLLPGERLAPTGGKTSPSFLPARLAGPETEARAAFDPSIQESERNLLRRAAGVAIPPGHWLTTAVRGSGGIQPGSLLTGASVGGRSAWSLGQELGALDAAAGHARSSNEPLVLELVTEKGLEQWTLAPQPDDAWSQSGAPRVDVTLSAKAPAGSEIASIIYAGAPVGFAVSTAVSATGGAPSPAHTAGPASPSAAWSASGSDAPSGLDPETAAAGEAGYRVEAESARTAIERDPERSPAEVQDLERAARATLDELRAYGRALQSGAPARSEREASERRARAAAELKVSQAGLEGGAELSGGQVADARLEVASAYVGAVREATSRTDLSVAERTRRIEALQGTILNEYWPADDGSPDTRNSAEVDMAIREIVDQPPDAARAPEQDATRDPVAEAAEEQWLARQLTILEGALDAWRAAARSGRDDRLHRAFATVFVDPETIFPDMSSDGTIDRRAQLAKELAAEAERLAAPPMTLADPRTREAIAWLGRLLENVRTGAIPEADALAQLEAHRRLGADVFGLPAETGAGAASAATAAPTTAPAPGGSAFERRFAGPEELERFLEEVSVGEQVQLLTADRRQRLVLTKQQPPAERDGRQYAATWSVQRIYEPPAPARG